jgi:hypothetical protein
VAFIPAAPLRGVRIKGGERLSFEVRLCLDHHIRHRGFYVDECRSQRSALRLRRRGRILMKRERKPTREEQRAANDSVRRQIRAFMGWKEEEADAPPPPPTHG